MKNTIAAIIFLIAGASFAQDNLICGGGGSGAPTGGNGTLSSLTVGFVDAGVVWLGPGSIGAPSLSFAADSNTGLYNSSADAVTIVTNGAASAHFRTTGVQMINGGATAPSINFVANSTTGLYHDGTGVGFAQAGANIANVTGTGLAVAGALLMSGTTPTISSGFGTSPSVTAGKAWSFRVNVGTGGTASSGVIALGGTAANGWNCTCTDLTTRSSTVFDCMQTSSTTTTATIGNFNSTKVAAAWVASDILAVICLPL